MYDGSHLLPLVGASKILRFNILKVIVLTGTVFFSINITKTQINLPKLDFSFLLTSDLSRP